jgi:hypothetical protein
MKAAKILAAVIVLAALMATSLSLIGVLGRLKSLEAGQARSAASEGTPAPADSPELREALDRLGAAQRQLAATEARLRNLTARVTTLEAQLQNLRQTPSLQPPASARELTGPEPSAQPKRAWGPEQVTGAPDTHQAGDLTTAWASREPDGGEEWLHLGYSNAVYLAEVHVRETFNPGAISKVAAVLPNGQEVVVWEGTEEPTQAPVETVFPVNGNVYAQSVKVYLDTKRVPGWNEIDAVELVGRDGSRQWASKASASSSYADR